MLLNQYTSINYVLGCAEKNRKIQIRWKIANILCLLLLDFPIAIRAETFKQQSYSAIGTHIPLCGEERRLV